MNQRLQLGSRFNDHDETCQLLWIVPVALALWTLMLTVFGVLLQRTATPPSEPAPVEARIIELPPAPVPAAIAPQLSGAKPRTETRPPKALQIPKPVAVPRPHPHLKAYHASAPRPPRSSEGLPTTRPPEQAPEAPATPTAGSAKSSSAVPSGSAPAGNAALGSSSADVAPGSDQGGARALFAPPPNIPDDLRDEPLEAVAIAHFVVGADGSVQVSLVQPTENARLNEVLLEALKLWRFAPAMKNGIAIASAFDVRIPISIQ